MPEKIDIKCPVCGASGKRTLIEPTSSVDDPSMLYGAASGVRGTQAIVQCTECGMKFESPRFPDETILKAYMDSHEAGHDSQYEMRVNSFLRTLKSLGDHIPGSGARVLDIGTAGGAFLDAGARYGYDSYGLEPSEYLVSSGKRKGLNIEAGTIENNPFKSDKFDMLCLWDVIEHLTDPLESLNEIHSLLKDDGVLLINYPDIGTLMARAAGRRFWWLLSVHLHYFDPKSIREICRRAGFEVFLIRRYWQTLEFGYLQGMAEHLKVPLAGAIKNITPAFIKKLPFPYYASQSTALARPIR